MKRVRIEIKGHSDDGVVDTSVNGVIIENEGETVLHYFEEFEGYSEKTKNILTVSHDMVKLEKSGGINAVMLFEMLKEHKATYHTGMGPIEMLVMTEGIFTKSTEEGLDISLDYTIDYGTGEPARNRLSLKARYI